MIERLKAIPIYWQELIFQVILHLLVFSFYSYDSHSDHPEIEPYHYAFFLAYAIETLFISYFLLPYFFYPKRYIQFSIFLLLVIAFAIIFEEMVLEQIYFPNSRGQGFPGVYHTLLEILPVMSILSGFKFAWDALVKQREVEELRATIEESELQFLKSQINPHFLFNNLNNLYSYAIENSPKTPTIILELSAVLRYMLYECREDFVALSKEIEHLENFTRLSQLQIEERGQVNFNAEGIQSNHQIAPLILIVFIENAFKHSQASLSDNILIDIHVNLSDNGELNFICKNNFHRLTNTDNLSRGIGLENVKKRLQLLYPNAHHLDIQETTNEYTVHLTMQLNTVLI